MPTIAFDAKRITHNTTGLGNYGRYVVDILSHYYPESNYHLYTPGKGSSVLTAKLPIAENIHYHYPGVIGARCRSLWRSFGVVGDLKRLAPDLYHGLSAELPFGLHRAGVASVVTIHDLIFNRYPEFYKPIDRTIYNYKFRRACETADRVVAISEMTRRDIITSYGIPEEKIDVVYQGCAQAFLESASPQQKQAVAEKYALPSHYVLYVGSIEQRKNLMLIVRALNQLKRDIKLVAIGKRTPYTDEVEAFVREKGLEEQVQLLHGVPFADLPVLYQQASLFIYPSFFEGFGIPIIEALHSDVPVIAATGSCLEEAGGAGSLYVDPNDAGELAEKIDWVLSTPSQAQKMREAGRAYVTRFSDEQIARDLMNVYDKVIKR